MLIPKVNSFNIKLSKNGLSVPVVNDVHIHSIYDPVKEAQHFVASNADVLKKKNRLLILGLGFAYHIVEFHRILSENFGDDFQIAVIEPSEDIRNKSLECNIQLPKNVDVYSGLTSNQLYQDRKFIKFLLERPAIIPHPASFQLFSAYFKDFLAYTSPDKICDLVGSIVNPELKKYLEQFDSNMTFESFLSSQYPKKNIECAEDYLMAAFKEITLKGRLTDSSSTSTTTK